MTPNYARPASADPRWKEPTRVKARKQKLRDREAERREVYDAVNRRDRYRCRVCGKRCDPTAIDLVQRGHHHHIVYRSKHGPTRTYNVILLDAECHAEVHAGRLFISGNADEEILIEWAAGRRTGGGS